MNFLKNIFGRKRFFRLLELRFNLRDVKSIKPYYSKQRPTIEVQVGNIVHTVIYSNVEVMQAEYDRLIAKLNRLWY